MGKISQALEKTYTKISHPATTETPETQIITNQPSAPPPHSGKEKSDGQNGWFTHDRWDQRLQLSINPHSPFFESFRRLRTPILHPSSGKTPKTILVTSVVPNEGKSFVCANLGIALAQGMEHHALMLDCDFRRPALSQLFGLSNDTGLVDHLQNNVDLSLLIRKTGQDKLSLIPCGKPPKNPSELLDSNRMISLINELSQRYQDRIILFDSPPNIVASETSILAKHLDGVILVVRYGASKREHIKKIVDTIGGEKILGLVFNAYPENTMESFLDKKMGYGYHDYYS
jgi:exopolysaccharide/PEP-CTERM locus tyrosine autokinase